MLVRMDVLYLIESERISLSQKITELVPVIEETLHRKYQEGKCPAIDVF